MSQAQLHESDFVAPAAVDAIRRRSLIVGVVATILALLLVLVLKSPEAFFRGYLLAFMAWLGVSLGSLGLLLVIHLTNGRWGLVIRRILEAAARNLWLMAALFVPLYLGVPRLYIWARPASPSLEAGARDHIAWLSGAYLNSGFFLLRAAIYFAIWGILVLLFTRWSREEDQAGNNSHNRSRILAGPGAVLFAFCVTFAGVDWVMSLDPMWASTMYGLIILIGQLLSALCIAVITASILARYKPMSELLQPGHLHDYGKFMLTFVMVWAYFSFSQWLIIWSGNLPEEISWYRNRLLGGWQYYSLFMALFHFVIPFTLLLSAQLKKGARSLVRVAIWLLIMRFADLYWLIMPTLSPQKFDFNFFYLLVPVAMGGFWLALFFRNLRTIPLLPLHAPLTQAVLEPAHD
jgi:hypothetical protein